MSTRTLLAGLTLALSLPAQTAVTLLPARDTTLYQSATGSIANGSGTRIFVGRNSGGGSGGSANSRRRAIVQFDVASAIPPGAAILTASLELTVEQTSATQPSVAFAHRVTAAWLEGAVVAQGAGGGGGAAVAGETTWLHRDYPSVLWASPGGDFDPTPSFTLPLPLSGATASAPTPGLVSDVQLWADNPASNHGWLLKTDELQPTTARRCWSREASTGQPKLTITYMLPGSVGLFGQRCPVVGGAQDFSLGVGAGGGAGGPVTGGTSVGLFYVTGPTNSLGATVFSFGIEPAGVQVFSGCAGYLRAPLIAGSTFVTDAFGAATATVPIPPGAPSLLLAAQGVALDPSPVGFTLSNAALMLPQ